MTGKRTEQEIAKILGEHPDRLPAPVDGYYCRQVMPCQFYLFDGGFRWCLTGDRSCPAFVEREPGKKRR